MTITKDDVLRAMERFDAELRATYPLRLWKKYAVKYNDKIYPPKDLLRLATGLTKVPGGGEPTNKHFEALGFTVIFLDEDATVEQGRRWTPLVGRPMGSTSLTKEAVLAAIDFAAQALRADLVYPVASHSE